MHYYHFNIADYRKDTTHLLPIEHYIYRTLIDWYYLDETPIPKETQVVIRRLRLDTHNIENVNFVLNDFFKLQDDGWHHLRIDSDIRDYQAMVEKNQSNGKLGGRPKKTQVVNSGIANNNPSESQINPNHKPITNNQDKSVVDKDTDNCPHQEIISLYKQILPMGRKPLTWSGSRALQLKARWREKEKRQSLDWWKGFFEYIAKSEFLIGNVHSEKRKPFEISLDWIVKSENFNNITEGKYHG